jgi:D-gamma-glutamyl-meso-diaminopimelic acid endopeptidase CwlS
MTIKDTIVSYRKRRKQLVPLIIGAAAVLLVVAGIIIVVVSASGGGIHLFATKTPTPTNTPSPTNTFTPTETATITETPTITTTATASSPYPYVVQEGDSLYGIMEQQGLPPEAIILIYMLNPYDKTAGTGIDPSTGNIYVGRTITLPNAGMQIPTPTTVVNTAPGTRITYMVLQGDGLGLIAGKWNTTIDAIVKANPDVLPDGQDTLLYPGMLLVVPINLVTPVPTATNTLTPTP